MPPSTIDARPLQIWMAEDNAAGTHLMREALDAEAFRYELRVLKDGEDALQLVTALAVTMGVLVPIFSYWTSTFQRLTGPKY